MYIEYEPSRLEYGDAVSRTGNKYATNFIIFRLLDRKVTEGVSAALIKELADEFTVLLHDGDPLVSRLDFYGHNFGRERLGYFLIPYLLRRKINMIKNNRLFLEIGPYPPRKDGGYGWFLVEETADENENCAEYNSGCNIAVDDSGSKSTIPSRIYYYWIPKYFDNDVYHNRGTRWLCANGIPQSRKDGTIEKGALSEEDAVKLIQNNLIIKAGDHYQLNFACFTEEQFARFVALFDMQDNKIDDLITQWILNVLKNFEEFVPARLGSQINQWVSHYLCQLAGYVVEELICRGVLKKLILKITSYGLPG